MSKTAGKRLKFEEALQRLEDIVHALETGEIGVEESVARYAEAMELAAHCRRVLDEAEQRVHQIQLDAAGGAAVTPFTPEAAAAPPADDDADA